MTFPVGMHNIPSDMHNIYPTCTTSTPADLRGHDVVDVVHVVPKKNSRSTYLLSVIKLGEFALRPVKAPDPYTCPCAYLAHNMHNIPMTSDRRSPSVWQGAAA